MSRTVTAMALVVAFLGGVPARAKADEMPWVAVSRDRKGFVLEPSGRRTLRGYIQRNRV